MKSLLVYTQSPINYLREINNSEPVLVIVDPHLPSPACHFATRCNNGEVLLSLVFRGLSQENVEQRYNQFRTSQEYVSRNRRGESQEFENCTVPEPQIFSATERLLTI